MKRIFSCFRALAGRLERAQKKHPALILLWCFLLPAALMLLVHACYGVYPFGRGSVLVLDLNGQYVYFFEALRRCVYGDASLLYSFSRNLGGEFLGIYAYYLASPLSYIVCLFPKGMILEALYLMFVLKCGLCGLTFGIFLSKTTKLRPQAILLFSAAYALSGYGMIMQHNTMWTDCAILLPLICLAVYALIRQRKYKLYVISLSLAILSNYYIGYMMCLFLLLYFFYCYFSQAPHERNPRGERFHFIRSLSAMGFFSVIAILIACLIILPAYYSLQFGKSDFTSPTFTFTSKFPLLDLFPMLLFNSYDTVRPEGLPILYCGVLSLFLIPLYFLSRRISVRERLASALIVFCMLFSFSIKHLDLIWHGFQAPNWLNYRYSFMLIFLLCVMAAKAFGRLRSLRPRLVITEAVLLILLILVANAFSYRNLDDYAGVYPNIAFVILYAIILFLLITSKGRRKKTVKILATVLVSVELFLGAILNLVALDIDVFVSSRDSYHDYYEKWEPAISEIKRRDPDFYRMEILSHQVTNDPYSLGYYGVSGSTSTLNAKVIDFLRKVGIMAESHWAAYCTSSPVTDSLLGLKYIFANSADSERLPNLYDQVYDDGLVSAYRNPYALPIAFSVDPMINTVTFNELKRDEHGDVIDDRTYYGSYSPLARLNTMLRCMLGKESDLGIYQPLAQMSSRENLNFYSVTSHTLYMPKDPSKEASITYTVKGDGEHEVYAFFPTVYMRTCSYYINGEFAGWLFTGNTYGYINLGVIGEGETLSLKIVLQSEDNRLYIHEANDLSFFYCFDEDAFTSAFDTLRDGGLIIDQFSETAISGHLTAADGRTTVMTTIPYDKGWIVEVDGERVKIYETLDALMAFDVEEGTHEISMRYMPDEYVLAFKLSMIGCGTFAAVMATEFVYRKITARRRLVASAGEEKEL